MPETSKNARALGAQQALAVLLGLPLHVLLVTATHDPGGILGTQDTLTPLVSVLLATQGLCGLLLWLGPAFLALRFSVVSRILFAALPLPLLLLMWPLAWHLATVGMLCSLVQGLYLVRAERLHPGHLFEAANETASAAGGDSLFGLAWRAAAGLLMLVLLVSGHGVARTPMAWYAVYVYVALALLISLPIEIGALFVDGRCRLPYIRIALLLAAVRAGVSPEWRSAVLPLLGIRQALGALVLWRCRGGAKHLWQRLTRNPAGLLTLSFLLAIVVGALLLDLPAAAAPEQGSVGAVDALFTATSAVCVTGLTVVDTGTRFSRLGQTIILALVQMGGLGVMTVSMFVALCLGRETGIHGESAMADMIGEERNRRVRGMLRFIVVTSLVTELAGAAVLACGFWCRGMAGKDSLYFGLFHSISAFCNAGFALFSDSFVAYAAEPLFPLTLAALIVAGGLGFSVLYALVNLRTRPRGSPLPPQVRLVLWASVVLWLGATAFFWWAERDGVFAGMPWHAALTNAWFQSVTARTAGFNTVDTAALSPLSQMLVGLLMFVGAGPGSTAGGIKVTTATVLVLLVVARLRGRHHVVVFGRRLDEETTVDATVIATLSLAAVLGVSALLLMTQRCTTALTPGMLSFEAISAFGTVGLSTGATPRLDAVGRLIIAVLMFVGRVGPLTLLVMMRPRRKSSLDYPVARVMVG